MTGPRPRFFYGWTIVAVLSVVAMLCMSVGGLTISVFITPMGQDLGFPQAAFAWAQTARLLVAAAAVPVVGRLLDRFGPRVVIPVLATIAGAGIMLLSLTQSVWHLVGFFMLAGLVGVEGPGGLFTSVPTARWFVRHRGRAMSLAFLGTPVGVGVATPLVQLAIDGLGWRTAWTVLGATCILGIVPLALVFLRRQPEDLGLAPDGVALEDVATDRGTPPRRLMVVEERSWTRAEALRTVAFWRMAAVFGALALSMGALGLYRIPHFIEQGISARAATVAYLGDGAAAVTVALGLAFVLDRLPLRAVGAAAFVVYALCIVVTIGTDTLWELWLGIILYAVAVAALLVIQNVLWAQYFGRWHLGSIRGMVLPVTLGLSVAGTLATGYIYDLTGSYLPVWYVLVFVPLAAAVLLLTSRSPVPVRHSQDRPLGVS